MATLGLMYIGPAFSGAGYKRRGLGRMMLMKRRRRKTDLASFQGEPWPVILRQDL